MKTLTCQQCGESFEAHRRDAKYCSNRCRKAVDRARHGEEINARNRERYRTDPVVRAKRLDAAKAYKAADPERARAVVRAWMAKNHDRRLEYARRYREENREAARRYAREDFERRQQDGGVDPEWRAVLVKDPCAYCGAPAGEVDHVVALSAGGTNDNENLTAACRSCNAKKHTRGLLVHLALRLSDQQEERLAA